VGKVYYCWWFVSELLPTSLHHFSVTEPSQPRASSIARSLTHCKRTDSRICGNGGIAVWCVYINDKKKKANQHFTKSYVLVTRETSIARMHEGEEEKIDMMEVFMFHNITRASAME
jgi:hypothetical protein